MKIISATIENIDQLVPLFDKYRIFYKQSSDPEAARKFLIERLNKKESVIFIAVDTHKNVLGFTQLYPVFSSVSLQRAYILNDLYVTDKSRGKGIGEALMNHAKKFAIEKNSKGLTLETHKNNPAQKLYERLGWKKDIHVLHYTWEI